MARVYVVQENRKHDIGSAAAFGELVVLLPEDDGILLSTYPTMSRLKRSLASFGDDDFLLLSGDPVAIGLAAMVASEANNGRVGMLKWHKNQRRYFQIRADVHLRPVQGERT
jgi:hypothetical protein